MSASEPADVADIVVRNCDIVTMDDRNTVIRDGAVVVKDGRITWVGVGRDLPANIQAKSTLSTNGRILLPGLVDAHIHTVQHFLKGKLAQMSRTRALKNPPHIHYYVPYEGMLTPDEVHLAGLMAFSTMVMGGTTCFADAGSPHPDELGHAALEVGLRGFVALSTIDEAEFGGATIPASMLMTPDEAHDKSVEFVKRWRDGDRIKAWLCLRQIIVCSPQLIDSICTAARDLDVKVHTHLSAGTYEVDHSAAKFGRRPVEYLAERGFLSKHLHGAHCLFFSPKEMDLFVEHKSSACSCSFHNYAMGMPRLTDMWRRNVPVGLGSDGVMPFGSLDIFQVAHAARIGEQAIAGAPYHLRAPLSSEELLKIATRGGARALGLEDEIGIIEVGRRADFILCDQTEMDQLPVQDPLYTAASNVIGRDVRSVVIDGKIVMKEREMLTVDLEKIRSEFAARQPAIMERFEEMVR